MAKPAQPITEMNLYQKLAKIRKIADVAIRDKSGFNYTYADVSQILAKVKTGMEKYHVSLIPLITPGTSEVTQLVTVNTKSDKAGNRYDQTTTEILFKADMVFKWVDDDNREELPVPWVVTGSQSDPSQAFGSGMTYCTRYFLVDYFQIPQVASKDVDEYRSKQKEAEAAEDKAVAEAIIVEFDTLLKTYLADHPESKDEAVKFITRFVKNANYFTIKNPDLAAKLLGDFKEKFISNGG